MITLFGCAHFFKFVSFLLYPMEIKRLRCAMLGAFTVNLFTLWNCFSINLRSRLYHLDSLSRAFCASTCNRRWRSQMRLTLKEQPVCGMFCPGWQKWHGMLCPGWQKQHGMLCPGWQKQHGMFCPGWQIFVGCLVRGGKKWHGMFCPGMFCPADYLPSILTTVHSFYNTMFGVHRNWPCFKWILL